jgi:hypothetical protein
MEAVLRKAQDKTVQLLSNKDTTFHASSATPAEPPPKRFRIIVGGADRIENLWPH